MQRIFHKIVNDSIVSSSEEDEEIFIDDEEIVFSGNLMLNQDKDKEYSVLSLAETDNKKSIEESVTLFSNSNTLNPKLSTYSNLNINTVSNFILESSLTNNTKNNNRSLSPTISQLNSKYSAIISKKSIEDSNCDVCGDEYSWEDDELVVCELCNHVVHQGCYGGDIYNNLPSRKWYCQRCEHLTKYGSDHRKIKCHLCPDLCGMMKKIDNKWFHIDCVNWTPEIYFEDELKSKINLTNLNRERFDGLKCDICKIKEGSCIQCDYKDCYYSFHVRCGKKAGLIAPWEEMERYQDECEEEAESIWTDKEGSAHEDNEDGLIMVEGDYEVIGEKLIQKKRGRGRPRKTPISSSVNYSQKKKILFNVVRNGTVMLPRVSNKSSNVIINNLNKKNSAPLDQNPKTNDSINQRIFLQNNLNNCKTSTKTFFEREKKLKFLGFKN